MKRLDSAYCQNLPDPSLRIRRFLRKKAGDRTLRFPIEIIPGRSAPRLAGEGPYHTNKSGDIIRHPAAYGYPTVYHPSTNRVTVGVHWLFANTPYKRDMVLETMEAF